MDLAKLYETQISFTEWFEKIGHASANEMRKEDNDKRERLSVLHKVLGLPFDKPYQFLATQILETSLVFKKFLKEHGDELCALRLIPLDNQLPKLRIRGRKIRDTLSWFNEQKIDPAKYRVDFVPHIEVSEWSTIFVVNQKGIFGEIIKGGHHQLTQGFYDQDKPLRFSYNFTDWQLSSKNEEAVRHLKEVIRYLHVGELSVQQKLKEALKSTLAQGYLEGYFETATSKEFGIWFIDYNRILGKMFQDFAVKRVDLGNNDNEISGSSAYAGKIQGKVRIIPSGNLSNIVFNDDEILVCEMTTPEFIPLMQKAAAIITDKGGILSHAAIISRELKIPCITGTEKATSIFKDGDLVEVDADRGIVRKL